MDARDIEMKWIVKGALDFSIRIQFILTVV